MSVSTKQEAEIKRNPHPDFKEVEAARPDWDRTSRFRYTKTAAPSWSFGDGANSLRDDVDGAARDHICIDPYAPGRSAPLNYKLLISGIVPRPIGFVSTLYYPPAPADDQPAPAPQENLAPFSYFAMVHHDPPLFVLGLVCSPARPKDTLRNLLATRECVVSVVGEDHVEAANAAAVDLPTGVSEWAVCGLTPARDCADVRAPRVREAVFSIECRVDSVREFESRARPGTTSGCMVMLEGTRFWVREDALDAEHGVLRPEVLRPVARVGGISYARIAEAFEIPRPRFKEDVGGMEGYEKLRVKYEEKLRQQKEKEGEGKGESGDGVVDS
ncbi:hypothetical protein GGS23DRAFT_595266 [Durotheca rogersii]|uniref:uncharacterized protein n=1 Tax=Durotheca rogersii TaxID=419775 RepID=UPI00222045F6|nr:uncharacterized protein GGS23DRAFT_595266 [Durotheca rogersii]KAI5864542.1 hypothetical protein GGS23DRAFT_595266 [Durotheca rogersii]